MEDVEKMVKQAVPDVEFVPSGLAYSMKKPRTFFRKSPRSEILLLAGVHPNCESMTLLVSDGQRYRGINYYLKKRFSDVAVDLAERCKKIEPTLDRLDPKKFFQRWRGRAAVIRALLPWGLKSVDFVKLADGKPVRTLLKLIFGPLFRKQLAEGLSSSRRPRRLLRVGMLPFEEQHSVDAARMESCKAVFAYEDTEDSKTKYVPACLWYPYRNPLLKNLSEKYGVVRGGKVVEAAPPAATPVAT
jgi:hypothetical protein